MPDASQPDPPFALSRRARRTHAQPIAYLMAQAVTNRQVISLAAGLVDAETLPADETAALASQMLTDPAEARAALQYGTTSGLAELRQRLLEHMAALHGFDPAALGASADDVVVTTGSQQLLFMLTDVLVNPGDIVLTAWPSYFVYTGTLQTFGAQVRCIDMDTDGILPESLERTLGEIDAAGDLPRVKVLYLISYHQNPTGITLSADRRPRVLEIVRRYSRDHRILVLDDAAYCELTYEGTAPPSLKAWDQGNTHVALLQTFSKPFAPGLKTGYGLLPRDLVEPVVLQKGNHDFGSTNFAQHLLLAALRGRAYEHHLARLRRQYAAKRDAMLQALAKELGDFHPDQTHWTRPAGGLYVYLTLPPGLDTGRDGPLFRRALDEGVLYVPGEYCYGPDPTRTPPTSAMRLSFGSPTAGQIRTGVARLARAIRAVAADARAAAPPARTARR